MEPLSWGKKDEVISTAGKDLDHGILFQAVYTGQRTNKSGIYQPSRRVNTGGLESEFTQYTKGLW